MLKNWGIIDLLAASEWTTHLKNKIGDNYDRVNLHLSGILIRNSTSIKVTQKIASTAQLSTLSGPEMLAHTISQKTVMSDAHVHTMSKSLGKLSLGDIPVEHVPGLTTTVGELARQLQGSKRPPDDLLNLISKSYTKGTVDIFH